MMNRGIVIIGSGICGANAAVTLRQEGYREPVTLIGQEPGTPFGRPPLSKGYLRGEEDLTDWLVKPGDWYHDNGIDRVAARVAGLDISAHETVLEGGARIAYDRLLIATGGDPRKINVPGAELAGVFSLRTQAECDAIREAAQPGTTAAVVGMGFIGAEVAASLRQMGVHVTAVSSGTGPLAGVLGDEVAAVLAAVHRGKGVDLVIGDRAAGFTGDGHVAGVATTRGARIACDFAVVGVGVEPAVAPLAGSGVAVDNGVLVDEQCRTSVIDVFAAGDVANHLHPVFGRLRVEHFNNAERQGRAAARNMLDANEPYTDLHSFWSDQYENHIEYVGHAPRWDQFVVRGSMEDRAFLGFYLEAGEVKAIMGMNRGGDPEADEGSELDVARSLVRLKKKVAPDALADERVDLRSLALAADASA
jgi:3-phenylpropionate/trans-cinnamate dioxygenase ferredoxin reductase subunit